METGARRTGEPAGTHPPAPATRPTDGRTRGRTAEETAPGRSFGDILRELRDEGSTLVRQEVALAKAEVQEMLEEYRRNAIAMGLGLAVLVLALLPLVESLVRGLTALFEGWMGLAVAVWVAPLIVAVALGAVGYALFKKGTRGIRGVGVVPERTKESLQQDKRWIQERAREMKEGRTHG